MPKDQLREIEMLLFRKALLGWPVILQKLYNEISKKNSGSRASVLEWDAISLAGAY